MPEKRCCICRETIPLEAFNRRRKSRDGLQPHCRGCNAKASKAYYRRNRTRHKQDVKRHKAKHVARNLRFLQEYRSRHPCVDCGKEDPVVLDFDHVRGDKEGNVGYMAQTGVCLGRLKKEVAKCEMRCVNCHRRRTALTQDWWKHNKNTGA